VLRAAVGPRTDRSVSPRRTGRRRWLMPCVTCFPRWSSKAA
jgi:hypothetical protein